jgi:hypothetical protein
MLEGRLCVVRTHIEGESIEQLIQRLGPLATDDAIRLVIRLLERLSEVADCRISSLRPSQIILTSQLDIKFVDLDETEVVFLKRNVRLKSSNTLALPGSYKVYIAPEIFHRTQFDWRKSTIYSVGRILEFLTRKDLRQDSLISESENRSDSFMQTVASFIQSDPAQREGGYDSALRRLRLAIQSAPSKAPIQVRSDQIDLSKRPSIRTLSAKRCAVAIGLFAGIAIMCSFSTYLLVGKESVGKKTITETPNSDSVIHSDNVFQIE